jgi:hypothetical protein
LGYSTGLMVGFAALDMEIQLPAWQRHIGGFIPVDYFYKTLDPAWQQSDCEYAQMVADLLQTGVYQVDYGVLFQTMGFLAQFDPTGDSPIAPGLTNLDVALFAAALTGAFFDMPDGTTHFFGGVFDAGGNPVELEYMDLTHYLEWLQQFNNYNSNFVEYDIAVLHYTARTGCGDETTGLAARDDTPLDRPAASLTGGGGSIFVCPRPRVPAWRGSGTAISARFPCARIAPDVTSCVIPTQERA